MAITYSEDGKKKVRKGNKKAIAMGKEFFGVPKDVREASKRQYKAGSPGAAPYTQKDMDTIRNYYKKKNKKGKV